MSDAQFQKPTLEVARENLARLFEAFATATGIAQAVASEIVADDRAFVYRAQRKPINFTTYDHVVGRFSAIWPAGADWPAPVPRLAPEALPPKAAARLAEATAKVAERALRNSQAAQLPGGAPWPSDIPQPGKGEHPHG